MTHIIKQNIRYWPAGNPYEHHEHPLYNHKVTLRCAVFSTAINTLHFFKDEDEQAITVMTYHYTHITEIFLISRVQNFARHKNLLFQQDGATANMPKN
jgi:hypothetical protein